MGWLSWLTGGRRDDDGTRSPAGIAPVTRGPSVGLPGWREVPPLQRTVRAPALVTDPAVFRGSLGTWQDASLFTPLGHLVSPEAPSGLVHGVVAPSGSGGVPTVSREVRPGGASAVRGLGTPGLGGARLPVVPLQRAVDVGGSGGPSATFDGGGTDGGSSMNTGGGTGAGSATAAAELSAPLVSARPPELPLRRLGHATVEGPSSGTGPEGSPAPSPSAASASSSVPLLQRAAEPGSVRPHGFGLGEPLTALPPTAQRKAAASSRGPLPTDEPESGPPEARPDALPDGPRVEGEFRPLLADDPLGTRTADTVPAPEPQPRPSPEPERGSVPAVTAVATPVPIQRAALAGTPVPAAPIPAPGPVAPLVAQRSVPLFSGVLPSGGEGAPGARTEDAEPHVVPLRWSAESGPATAADPAPAPETPSGRSSVPPVQRSPAAKAAPAESRPVPDAGAVAVAAGVAQRMTDGSVVFGAPPATPVRPVPYGPPAPVPRPPAVQRMPSAPALGYVQRDTSAAEPPPPDPPDPPMAPEVPAPSAQPPPEPLPENSDTASSATGEQARGPSLERGMPKVDDELVRALFAPLSRLLKAELRLDRERAGRLIDTRH
ncbi:hypothetical protein [Streptomyces nodosus]|uniref:Uncharacterized protein n=1 Tax=Streptomyces nodosus TaxID=40318 RepID=A0A0B5DKW9_9ACTN|nr:hypothetical protein [Streptomyces nodosus]AJE43814.1 hypothetical protein SNOD_30280 [Streptomyces nodosus]QEV42317.1 hypothetical protein CP978_30585 [Streptomyces nodosus]